MKWATNYKSFYMHSSITSLPSNSYSALPAPLKYVRTSKIISSMWKFIIVCAAFSRFASVVEQKLEISEQSDSCVMLRHGFFHYNLLNKT